MAGLLVLFGVGQVSVDLGEAFSDSLSQVLSGLLGLEVVVADFLELEVIDDEPGGHDVALVQVFDEWLDGGFSDEFFLVVGAFGSEEVAGDACDEEVRESVFLGRAGVTLLPVSLVLMTTAFLPAYFPWVMTTTLPVLKLNEGRGTF